MRHTAIVLFALLLQQRQCSMVSPDAIKAKVEEALRPYFPNARGQVAPQQQAIIGLTCTNSNTAQVKLDTQESTMGQSKLQQYFALLNLGSLWGAMGTTGDTMECYIFSLRHPVALWHYGWLDPWG